MQVFHPLDSATLLREFFWIDVVGARSIWEYRRFTTLGLRHSARHGEECQPQAPPQAVSFPCSPASKCFSCPPSLQPCLPLCARRMSSNVCQGNASRPSWCVTHGRTASTALTKATLLAVCVARRVVLCCVVLHFWTDSEDKLSRLSWHWLPRILSSALLYHTAPIPLSSPHVLGTGNLQEFKISVGTVWQNRGEERNCGREHQNGLNNLVSLQLTELGNTK